eukprot:CAMPEP_0204266998 /NCGR_PEP_ID=MMETSP0468-20130131/10680_1 /ASSEMBLY_ACC=CAM_ASM_000383 /TAXON_ID=2969 /ORGANISM="Oxyrrhis marina" /LENGTH=64 /DNA_ID=CAMNT_0051242131 /DNA_START=66 /DNA_END=260 /DNA_ORIENTATION=+
MPGPQTSNVNVEASVEKLLAECGDMTVDQVLQKLYEEQVARIEREANAEIDAIVKVIREKHGEP